MISQAHIPAACDTLNKARVTKTMTDLKHESSDKYAFVEQPVNYERRVVAFYDVMGWKSKIEWAEADVEKITLLKNMVRLFSVQKETIGSGPFKSKISTFSDNVVISAEPTRDSILTLLMRLATTQYGAAQLGFLIRGGVAVGNVVHDEHVVFGPGLNQAYYLEDEVANKPRIVLDTECLQVFGGADQLGRLIANEDDIYFLDPWTIDFMELRASVQMAQQGRSFAVVRQKVVEDMISLMQAIGAQLRWSIDEKDRKRVQWLYDRVAAQVARLSIEPNQSAPTRPSPPVAK